MPAGQLRLRECLLMAISGLESSVSRRPLLTQSGHPIPESATGRLIEPLCNNPDVT